MPTSDVARGGFGELWQRQRRFCGFVSEAALPSSLNDSFANSYMVMSNSVQGSGNRWGVTPRVTPPGVSSLVCPVVCQCRLCLTVGGDCPGMLIASEGCGCAGDRDAARFAQCRSWRAGLKAVDSHPGLDSLTMPMAMEPDSTQPDSGRPELPKLEFKPDATKAARVRAFRIVTFGLAMFVLAVCLVWLVVFRPRTPTLTPAAEPVRAAGAESLQPSAPIVAVPVTAETPESALRNAVSGLETLLNDMKECWRRAAAYVPLSTPGAEQLDEAVSRVRRAVVLAESAAALAAEGPDRLSGLKTVLRKTGAGGYRASVVGSAADEFVREISSAAADRLEHFRAQEQAYAALVAGDAAEFEIKGDVATAYLRKSESAERRIVRARERLRSALLEFERGR